MPLPVIKMIVKRGGLFSNIQESETYLVSGSDVYLGEFFQYMRLWYEKFGTQPD